MQLHMEHTPAIQIVSIICKAAREGCEQDLDRTITLGQV